MKFIYEESFMTDFVLNLVQPAVIIAAIVALYLFGSFLFQEFGMATLIGYVSTCLFCLIYALVKTLIDHWLFWKKGNQ